MKVDLDTEGPAALSELPRFQRSLAVARRLVLLTYLPGLAALAMWLVAYALTLFNAQPTWLPLLCVNAAALLILAATAQSAWRVADWRGRAIDKAPAQLAFWPRRKADEDGSASASAFERSLFRLARLGQVQLQRLGFDALVVSGCAVLALLLVKYGWRADLTLPAPNQMAWVAVGLLVTSAFFLVVVERHLAVETEATWPEAKSLALVLRLVIAVQLLSIPCLIFGDGARLWPARLAMWLGVLPAIAAVELLTRAIISVFSPQRPRQEPQLLAKSVVAGILQWPPRPLAFLQGELHQRFGIDLRQIWAFAFMRRAFLPVAALLAVAAWLLTGVVEIPMHGRGVYERFGKPVEVYPPGLHAGLPWPFGKVISVDNGVVHELLTSGSDRAAEPLTDAEGAAPLTANRLWDATHLSENSQVIAGTDGDRQSFQIVNMDVRFIYRIGLSDAAALSATYNTADVAVLVRSIANRILVHDFAGRSLDGVLGAEREAIAKDVGRAVQADLDRLNSGVEILATSVEAIHPPAGAANAYHGVQAAQIKAQAFIARIRGQAAQRTSESRTVATALTNLATAVAHETSTQAQMVDLRFGAERDAWHKAGQAFTQEQYLSRLTQALSNSNSLIIDHRLAASQAPTVDLRSFTPPIDPSLALPAYKRNQESAN
ncbi:TPA: protease modulator HflK [Pseudomonas aeruginosa]|nr:protease modulator HflK [Pseudomonas aeruginosa]HBO3334068.1 protease modulator HflK [Pseudomonas aeruginosa]